MCTSCHGAGDGPGRGPQDCAVIGRPQMQSRAASWKQAGHRGFLTQLLSMLRAADSGFVGQQEGLKAFGEDDNDNPAGQELIYCRAVPGWKTLLVRLGHNEWETCCYTKNEPYIPIPSKT